MRNGVGLRSTGIRAIVVAMASAVVWIGTPAHGDELERRGLSMVTSISGHEMEVDDEVYRVSGKTRIQRANGFTALLSDIRIPTVAPNQLLPATSWDYIRYEASLVRGQWHMDTITILESRPE